MVKNVSELKQGEMGCISAINNTGALGIRLMEMGLIPGTFVKSLRKSSHHGLMEISVRGCKLILGLAEAQEIYVSAQ